MVNFLDGIPKRLDEERIDELVRAPGARIERIISTGQRSPADFWYDQAENEWVMVLAGAARLAFDDPPREISLKAGDYVDIPAHTRHRVAWTTPDTPTVWLAVFY